MRKRTTLQKLHRWPGFIMALFLIILASSGVVLNHRSLFSGIDVSRKLLPQEYRYENWNNASVKGNVYLEGDSSLLYGNVGMWLTDSLFRTYSSFNKGLPEGLDNRKVYDVKYSPKKNLYAATHFGLYAFHFKQNKWVKLATQENKERFVALEIKGDSIYALSRSLLYIAKDQGVDTQFEAQELQAPADYKKEVSLFETIWQIHSGEIFGLAGKILVDILAIITLILSVTGVIYFIFPSIIRSRKKKQQSTKRIGKINKVSLRWHNQLGAWTFLLLILCYFTGMFLRPPLLIPIAGKQVKPIRYSHLDQANPWHDKLRDLLYDAHRKQFIVSTAQGMYFVNPANLSTERCQVQPPVSVMGITCFREFHGGTYIVGSFSGLFLWNPTMPRTVDFLTGQPHGGAAMGRPVGQVKVSGMLVHHDGYPFVLEYEKGAMALHHELQPPLMPEKLQETDISLWNFALEFHTLRVFNALLGEAYILLIPLVGLCSIMVLLSGYLYWRRRYRKGRG